MLGCRRVMGCSASKPVEPEEPVIYRSVAKDLGVGIATRAPPAAKAPKPRKLKVAITVSTLNIALARLQAPKTITIHIEEIGMFDAPLETKRLAYTGSRLPIDWSREVEVAPGGRAWAALHATISDDSAPGALRFTVRHETEANGSRVMGGAALDLRKLLEQERDQAEGKLRELILKEPEGGVMGQLTISIIALDAMRKVRAGDEDYGRAQ